MKTIITILISIFIYIPSIYSQTYTPEWAVRFNAGESSYDLPTKMAVDSAGNVYVTGKSWINGSNYDYSTVKYNTAGVFQWEARYNGPGDYIDEPTGIVVDKSGNVFVTGNSYGGSSDYDFATIKYNSNGVQQWVDRYNGALDSTEKVNSIAVDNSGNIFVSGQSMKYTTIYSNEVITIKYKSSGTRLWVNSYKYFNNTIDEAQTMKLDKAGNVYVVSLTYDYLYYSNNVAHTIKYNSNGVQQWLSNFNRYALSYIYLSLDEFSNSFLSANIIAGNGYGFILKYDSSGVQQWINEGTIKNSLQYIKSSVDRFRNCYVLCTEEDLINNGYNIVTRKYSSTGILQWKQTYIGTGNLEDFSNSLIVDLSGNVYVTGYSNYLSSGSDFVTIKYNSSGIKQWVSRYTGCPYADEPIAIGLDYSGNAYVTGSSVGYLTEYDYLTLKYPGSLQLNATVLIEGLYNQGTNRLNTKDTLTAYLRNTSFPYAIADSGKAVIDSVNFLCGFCFNRANAGIYYISIKHRNSIETWSKTGGEVFSKNTPTYYNFTTSGSQSYGNNLKLKGSKYCIYSGNVNQDFIIDAGDISAVENDVSIGASGYKSTDLNGDNFVDAGDLSIVENNIGVGVVTP